MALAAALTRGDIKVAYICLIPAIIAYANGKVPIKVVAGTHKYGYGLLVDPKKIKAIKDLEKSDIHIGCPREGSPPDVLLHKMIDKYHLDESKILKKNQKDASDYMAKLGYIKWFKAQEILDLRYIYIK
ncbi:MAG: hypothetical protein ACKVE3_09155 [Dissulfuribacterales bacterium]